MSQTKETIKQIKRNAGSGLRKFIFGDWLSSQFFGRHKITVIMVICLFLAYITIKYECQTHMETIAKLETELSIVKSESIREQSTFKSRTRESSMQRCIDSLNLALRVQTQPPYKLSSKSNKK